MCYVTCSVALSRSLYHARSAVLRGVINVVSSAPAAAGVNYQPSLADLKEKEMMFISELKHPSRVER